MSISESINLIICQPDLATGAFWAGGCMITQHLGKDSFWDELRKVGWETEKAVRMWAAGAWSQSRGLNTTTGLGTARGSVCHVLEVVVPCIVPHDALRAPSQIQWLRPTELPGKGAVFAVQVSKVCGPRGNTWWGDAMNTSLTWGPQGRGGAVGELGQPGKGSLLSIARVPRLMESKATQPIATPQARLPSPSTATLQPRVLA